MEGALRHGQEQSLQATSAAVAAVLRDRQELLYPNELRLTENPLGSATKQRNLYASRIKQRMIIDGYGDDWQDIGSYRFNSVSAGQASSLRYRAAVRQNTLYLLLEIEDSDVVFHNPALSSGPNGDRLILRTWQNNERQEYIIATAAPGQVTARYGATAGFSDSASRIRGYWQDTPRGYNLELALPLALTGGRLGVFSMNVTRKADSTADGVGNITPLDTGAPPWLIYGQQSLQAAIAPFGLAGRQLFIIDKSQWLLAQDLREEPATQLLEPSKQDEKTFWLLRWLYRSILSRDEALPAPPDPIDGKMLATEVDAALSGSAKSIWYRGPQRAGQGLLSAASPIIKGDTVIGAVVLRQNSNEYLSLTDKAFSRLLGYSMLALGIGVLGLLGFASLLSWRIRKLSLAASEIIQQDGSLGTHFSVSKAQDEIGELSRHYGDMLDKLRQYNDYLRSLSRKLSHELRTPIAVIQTSLEHLDHAEQPSSVYIARAQQGLSQLNSILTAMSEANRLEESIRSNELCETDLAELLREVFIAYVAIYPQHNLSLQCSAYDTSVCVAPDLIVQALDKLMDNAASFTPDDGHIIVALQAVNGHLEISVCNEGPLLPEDLQQQLFESMVSLRTRASESVHMGLGLYIVRLVAEFHRGSVHAENLADGTGVRFVMLLSSEKPTA
jgi:two-component system sensor histidine kinase ChvG